MTSLESPCSLPPVDYTPPSSPPTSIAALPNVCHNRHYHTACNYYRAMNRNLEAELSSANVEIGALTSSINSVANCTGGTCVPRIPTCSFSSLSGASMTATGLVASVSTTVSPGVSPLGAVIMFSAAPGYYLAAGASTQTTCHDNGWSNPVPTVGQCMSNCNMCTTGSDCQQCANG